MFLPPEGWPVETSEISDVFSPVWQLWSAIISVSFSPPLLLFTLQRFPPFLQRSTFSCELNSVQPVQSLQQPVEVGLPAAAANSLVEQKTAKFFSAEL